MISTKARYALRVMIDLAEHQDAGYIPLKDIAARQEISEKYLEIIIKILVKGKMLKGLRGKGGGYILTREPSEYIVGDIIELTEGPLAPVACLQPDAEVCNRKDICVTLPLWEKYYTLVHDFFFHITLEDVINSNF
ncbi:RrF2 family transcriptional regulator [Dorea ammoniilytica]|uniref:Rrf2 family transcriptional regulator n=1 Tax=Dorea ammoniilytica TaxID=2981788 RepID=A0ABT2S987_9FIRM|nr:Rrf2 family transcriptional regulator [Dorea ammoniilytica]MCU6701007.1 Rrf2 family transcriptional regulator [Dorea ammoniilytica]SCI12707.1 Cysteine metabolism repressor [uncultured Eubacterium sp.]